MIMKNIVKNHCIFVQNWYFSIQNHRFCRSRCIDEAKNVAKLIKIVHFHRKFIEKIVYCKSRRSKKKNKKTFILNVQIHVFLREKLLLSSFQVCRYRQKTCKKLSFFIENASFLIQKSYYFQWKINVFTHPGI